MTITLKKQLGLWFGGALICVVALQGARALAAPEEKLSAEEVSRRFTASIDAAYDNATYRHVREQTLYLVSTENQTVLGDRQIERLVQALSESYAGAAYDAHKVSEKNGKTVISVVPRRNRPGKEFVCVKENGGYKIDLIATYARWNNNLSGVALAERIFDVSGAVLPNLPRVPKQETSICQSNMKQISLGILQYTQDYDERLPLTRGWSQSLEPYLRNRQLFNCPSVRPASRGYAYNEFIADKHLAQISEVTSAVNFFDSKKLSTSAVGGKEDISNRHRLDSGSGANVAFIDGHVKFIGSSYKWNDNRFTFTPKIDPYDPSADFRGLEPVAPAP